MSHSLNSSLGYGGFRQSILCLLLVGGCTLFSVEEVRASESRLGLTYVKSVHLSADTTAKGIAIGVNSEGAIYVLYDNPPQLIVWQEGADLTSTAEPSVKRFADVPGLLLSPTDLVCDLEVLIADPTQSAIIRFDRRHSQLPSLIFPLGSERFEPSSLCKAKDGTLFIVNQADHRIYHLKREGGAVSIGEGYLTRSGVKPRRIRYVHSTEQLAVLCDDRILLLSTLGSAIRELPLDLVNPSSIAVAGDRIWIGGEGLQCWDIRGDKCLYMVDVDDLREWKAYPLIDVAVMVDNLYLLPQQGGGIVIMKITE